MFFLHVVSEHPRHILLHNMAFARYIPRRCEPSMPLHILHLGCRPTERDNRTSNFSDWRRLRLRNSMSWNVTRHQTAILPVCKHSDSQERFGSKKIRKRHMSVSFVTRPSERCVYCHDTARLSPNYTRWVCLKTSSGWWRATVGLSYTPLALSMALKGSLFLIRAS